MSGNEKAYGFFSIYSVLFRLMLCEKLGDGCGYSVLGPESGVLTSRNYPGTYPNNSWCEWRIVLPRSTGLLLRFGDISIEASECDANYVRIHEGLPADGRGRTFCGQLSSPLPEVHTEASEVTVQFRSGQHISGRGFLLSYSSAEHRDLITCLDTGSQFSALTYRKYCPVGCRAVRGDVSGDVSQGYRHTSALCKAAIHAGAIVDDLGGQVSVEQKKGLAHYPGTRANGVQSKDGSLSDTLFIFENSACRKRDSLPMLLNASSWSHITQSHDLASGPPNATHLASSRHLWIAGDDGVSGNGSSQHWLHLDLGEKRKVTDIVTSGSTLAEFDFYVQSFRIEYRERNRWKVYTKNNSSADMVFEGNVDCFHATRNTFHPPIVTRYLRVVPLSWHQRIALAVDLLGCPHVKVNSSGLGTPQPDGSLEPGEEMPDLVKLLLIVVPSVLLVLVVLLVVCACKMMHKKKTKENSFGATEYEKTGCWKHLKQPFARQSSTEFTISYSSDKDAMQKLDLVTSTMAVEYQQPPMIGVGTVSRKGSTFRPMDTDNKEEPGDGAAHYDYLHTTNQYALPLTNPEPEYATPIIERHAFRKDTFLPDPSYSVPGTVLSKMPSFSTADQAGCRVPGAFSGAYRTPQVKSDRLPKSEEVYDRPKVKASMLPNGVGSDYQRPQGQTSVMRNYSLPRDCVKRTDSALLKREQQGALGRT